jgi:hypothetical protein
VKTCAIALLLFALQLGELQRSGIGVAPSASATAPAKPTLVPMSAFPPQARPRTRAFFRTPVHEDGALIAVTGTRRRGVSLASDFPRLWRRAAPSQRVFIAFARRDLATVQKIERALQRKGYQCILYLHGRETPRWADAVELGRYYRESRNRFVLDSRAARTAVRLELLAQGRKSCCKRCYFVNGILAGCDKLTCGAHCANARGR